MIILGTIIIIIVSGIYTFSYGIYMAKKRKNALAAFGAILLTLLTIAATTFMLITRF